MCVFLLTMCGSLVLLLLLLVLVVLDPVRSMIVKFTGRFHLILRTLVQHVLARITLFNGKVHTDTFVLSNSLIYITLMLLSI